MAAGDSASHWNESTFAFCQSQMKEEGKQILAPRVSKRNSLHAFCAAIASKNKEGSQLINKWESSLQNCTMELMHGFPGVRKKEFY